MRRVVVVVVMLASLVAGTATVPHTEDPDDVACSPVAVSHNESAHHVAAAPASPDGDAQHCFLCHSLRSFHSVFSKFEHRDDVQRPERLHANPVGVTGRVEWTLVPGRAPPA